jgi:hypothetical protein
MQTRRCPNCHRLQRSSAQRCSRCGRSFARPKALEFTARVSTASQPIASPHRAGHYFGLHPEDQPYQSNRIVTPRQQAEFSDQSQEPAHIVLPSTASAPALKRYREAFYPPRSIPEQPPQTQRPLAPIASVPPLPAEKPRRSPGKDKEASPHHFIPGVPRRTLSLVLIVSCVTFLLAASIITLGHLNADRSGSNASLLAIPKIVRANDLFALRGEKWPAHVSVELTDESGQSLVSDGSQPLHIQTNSQGFFQARILAASNWHPGSHILYATEQQHKRTVSTTIAVQTPPPGLPSLHLSATSMDLDAAAAGVVSEQSLTLTNRGGGNVTWQASSDEPWLTFSPGNGTFAGQEEVQITANRGSLAPEEYTGHIQFAQEGQPQSALTLTVTMEVTPAPALLALSTAALSSSAPARQNPTDQNITIRNDGGQGLSWSASATTSDGASWLALTPASGTLAPGLATPLSVQIDSYALPVGTYSGLINFTGGASAHVRVTFSVVAPGNLVVSPPALSFAALAGQENTDQTLTMQNSGDLALDWSATVSTRDGGNWLAVTPKDGSLAGGGQTTIRVSAKATTLLPGAYQGTLTFQAGSLTRTVALAFTVTAAPIAPSPTVIPSTTPTTGASTTIDIQPTQLQITTVKGQQPAKMEITITNTGLAVLHWNALVDKQTAPYVQMAPSQGSLNPGEQGQIVLTVDASQADVGKLTGTMTIVDGETAIASKTVGLEVTVQDLAATSP